MSDSGHVHEVVCTEFVALATDYLERALPEHQTDLVEEHLVMCDWCKTYLDQFQATIEALPDAAVDQPVDDETRALLMTMFRDWKDSR